MKTRLSAADRSMDCHSRHFVLWATLVLLVSGCAGQAHLEHTGEPLTYQDSAVVLLMTPDIQLSELTTAGLEEPNAAWTARALSNVTQALDDRMRSSHDSMIGYKAPVGDPARAHTELQIIKLHRAVGISIVQHKYFQPLLLPTKTDVFDWGLGPDVQELRDDYQADYALFIYLRDSYASPGRAAMIVAMAVLGVGLQGGTQSGFASLVDLSSGEVVWFNRLLSTTGDLRTPAPARQAVDVLLTGFPL